MIEQKDITEMKRIVRFALWGAVGFCVGGAIGVVLKPDMESNQR